MSNPLSAGAAGRVLLLALWASHAQATVTQVDGSILPRNPGAMQGYLDAQGEGGPPPETALDAVIDADRFPEVFLPDTSSPVTFLLVGEGGGFENSFGWYNVGDDIRTDAGRARNLHPVLGCGVVMVDAAGAEDPAGLSDAALLSPPHNEHHHGNAASYALQAEPGASVTIDFGAEQAAGRYKGGFVAFYLISPESHASSVNCGDFKVDPLGSSLFGRIYHSQADLNNDGDYVHHLAYSSKRVADRFYFGFEDLFRGGDNDFEDVLTQVTGLAPPCVPTLEICDEIDNDCDGLVDDADPDLFGVDQPCVCDDVDLPCVGGERLGPCRQGATVCVAGEIHCAPVVNPGAEICDGVDNNCNGIIDDVPGPCVTETCNGLDDDGDGLTDELPLPGLGNPCGTDEGECERGVTCCAEGGVLDCCAEVGPVPETCDCLDNDCDGITDEDEDRICYEGPPGECDVTTGVCRGICRFGTESCVTTGCPTDPGYSCTGPVGPRPEECNCLDDDCDGETDDGATCANGAPCVGCACAVPCDPREEFPCSAGHVCGCLCDTSLPCFCTPDPCLTTVCEDGQYCDSCTGSCFDPCADCPAGTICCGEACCGPSETCLDGDCLTCADARVGCPEGRVCVLGRCEPDACASVECDPGRFCRDGECIAVCPECPEGQRCREGACVGDLCAGVVCQGVAQVCCDGVCGHDRCAGLACGAGETCDPCDGTCVDDVCGRTQCPGGYACRHGDCVPVVKRGFLDLAAGGVGGCSCATGGPPAGAPWLLFLALGAFTARRRWWRSVCGRPWLMATLAGLLAGCEVQSVRILDDAGVPGALGDAFLSPGCQPVAEICNGADDDCDGLVDDGDPGGGENCGIAEGACRLGETACVGGRVVCVGDVPPEAETCDELDNDCDGETDEAFDFCNNPDYCGSCFGSGGAGESGPCAITNAVATCDPTGCGSDCEGCAVCRIDGCQSGWTDCQGDDPVDDCDCPCSSSPGPEICDAIDNDCDGEVDEDVFAPCYTGPPGTLDIGRCREGSQACIGGVFSGPCVDEVTPGVEICNGWDDDCEGTIDSDAGGQALVRGCYDGPAGTEGVGTCLGGMEACAFGAWGTCEDQVLPAAERCEDGIDTDCDGLDDDQEGCAAPIGFEARLDEPGGPQGSSAGQFHSFDMVMVVAGDPPGRHVYVAWTDLTNGAADVFFRRSLDGGNTFEDIQNLTSGSGNACVVPGLAVAYDPAIGQDRVYVVYQTIVAGLRRVVMQRSPNNGANFSYPVDPANGILDLGGSLDSFHHDVSTDGDGSHVIVAWEEMDGAGVTRRIKSRASADFGGTFGFERELTVASGPAPNAGRPVTAVTGSGRFVVVWREQRSPATTFDVFANRSDDTASAFTAVNEVRLDGDLADRRASDHPRVRTAGEGVSVVWEDVSTEPGGGADILFARSSDGAATFSVETVLDDPGFPVSTSGRPSLDVDPATPAGDDDRVYVAWEDGRSGSQVYTARSVDSGATFFDPVRASSQAGGPTAGTTRWPSIAAFGSGGVAVAYDNDATGSRHVYVTLSIDDGASWSFDARYLDGGAGPAERPAAARIDDGGAAGVLVGWTDRRMAPGVHADPYAVRVTR